MTGSILRRRSLFRVNAERLRRRLLSQFGRPGRFLAGKPANEPALKAEYQEKRLDTEADTFALYRIIGNDLVPRHSKGQSRRNVTFMLDHEPELDGCRKLWIVNRIVDKAEEDRIVELLEEHGQEWIHIPFDAADYAEREFDLSVFDTEFFATPAFKRLPTEHQKFSIARQIFAAYRPKNSYVMNNNGARNRALEDGRPGAKWVLPWDGNCFLTSGAWSQIRSAIIARPHLKYFVVPMVRLGTNEEIFADDLSIRGREEPQVIFRRDAAESFNERFCYGRRSKIELLWRLGIPGPWDRFKDDPWDQPRPPISPEARSFGVAGWVARLASGTPELEKPARTSFKRRGPVRQDAVFSLIDELDRSLAAGTDNGAPLFFRLEDLDAARAALRDGGRAPLGDLAGVVVADAERAFAKTGAGSSESQGGRQVGSPLLDMFDDTTSLACAWYLTGREDFAEHAAAAIRRWFVDEATRIDPRRSSAMRRGGRDSNDGSRSNVVEFNNLYYFLDAVRLVGRTGALSGVDLETFRQWLQTYLGPIENVRDGDSETAARGHQETGDDLMVASAYAYLGEFIKVRRTMLKSLHHFYLQMNALGEQPEELARSRGLHSCLVNLQSWLHLFILFQNTGHLTRMPEAIRNRLAKATNWILSKVSETERFEQFDPRDSGRGHALALDALNLGIRLEGVAAETYGKADFPKVKPRFDPHDGVRPYWALAASRRDRPMVPDA